MTSLGKRYKIGNLGVEERGKWLPTPPKSIVYSFESYVPVNTSFLSKDVLRVDFTTSRVDYFMVLIKSIEKYNLSILNS